MKLSVLKLTLFSLLFPVIAFANLEVIVKDDPDWGPISTKDLKTLCENITDHFEKHLRPENEIHDKVNVYRTFNGSSFLTLDIVDPRVKFKMGIQLLIDLYIHAQECAYFITQFSHEFTHILQADEIIVRNTNSWFKEAIAEMAVVWTLRRMAETWKDDSPFGAIDKHTGVSFSDNFAHWGNWYLDLSPDYHGTGAEWLEEHEQSYRDKFEKTEEIGPYNIAAQLGYKFLPIFEEHPEAWNAVRKMPVTNTEKMSKYMQVWYDAVDVQDRQYVEAMAEIMGITVTSRVTPPVVASTDIDADIDNNGFVDLSDVLLVRSAMQNPMPYDTDVNNDGKTDELDVLLVKEQAHAAIIAAAPSLIRKRKITIGTWGQLKSLR